MRKKTLYLECYSGISGDMAVAALIDLGVDHSSLLDALNSLNLDGYRVKISRVNKSGIDACDFNVILDKSHENHDHDMEYLHGPAHHEHHHEHSHTHEHRNLESVQAIINSSGLNRRAKVTALKIFQVIAEAEAKAHNKPLNEVHFHEVGAVDSIVDITALAVCIDALDIQEVIVSELYEGQGTVRCQHGVLPVPVPAVANIVSAYGLPMHLMNIQGEFVTPTGAAIAAALGTGHQLPEHFRVLKTGIGAGKRNYEKASILRAMLIEDLDEKPSVTITETSVSNAQSAVRTSESFEIALNSEKHPAPVKPKERELGSAKREVDLEPIWKIETNLDDCTGEALAFASNQLFEAGAQDCYTTPIYMKKNRPGTMLTVLCRESLIPKMEDIIFTHTTTIGLRKYPVERTILPREVRTVDTPWGKAHVKYTTWKGRIYAYPENDDEANVAEKNPLAFPEVYAMIKALAYDLYGGYSKAMAEPKAIEHKKALPEGDKK